MPFITVYHCSPDKISVFNFDSGVHFGGLYSAYEAGLRKLENLQMYRGSDQDILFLHVCKLQCKQIYNGIDVGDYEQWLVEIEKAKQLGCDVIKYKNKYEPDSTPSYLVLSTESIVITNIEELDSRQVQNKLESHGIMMDF